MNGVSPTTLGRVLFAALILVGCGDPGGPTGEIIRPCDECDENAGGLLIELPLQASDLDMVTATVRAPDDSFYVSQSFQTVGGVVRGEILNILAGSGYKVHLEGFPSQIGPDADVAIWSGDDGDVTVVGGAVTYLGIFMRPVVGDVQVTALAPAADSLNWGNIQWVEVIPSGPRYQTSPVFWLSPVGIVPTGTWFGPAEDVFVGRQLTFVARAWLDSTHILYEGTVSGVTVTDAGLALTINMAVYPGNYGSINIDGSSACVPNCDLRECGPDPECGISCGDCRPGLSCDGAGQCN